MKRSPAPRRKAPMKRGARLGLPWKPLPAWTRTTTFKVSEKGKIRPTRRKSLSKVGSRAKREADALRNFREVALARAGGICERCDCKPSKPLDVHHVVGRGRAAGWPDLHNPEINALAIDRWCHNSLTLDPLDIGGPVEGRARKAHQLFESWRASR